MNAGVLLLRLAGLAPERKATIVSKAISKHLSELKGALSAVFLTDLVTFLNALLKLDRSIPLLLRS